MLDAVYFDGRSAQAHAVQVQLIDGELCVIGEGIERRQRFDTVQIAPAIGRAPRSIHLADGALCEIRDHAGFDALLLRAGPAAGWLQRAEGNWRVVLICLAIIVAFGTLFFVWGLPAGAQLLARLMPASLNHALSEQTLKALDRHLLLHTKLSAQHCAELQGAIDDLRTADGQAAVYRLEFRDSRRLGPNAFALPDGTIVLLDELVNLADNDEQILAVIGHELGHVHYQHGLRLLAQSSAVGLVTAWWFGDVSVILSTAPTLLLQARYSRAFEAEADRYAASLMQTNGIAPSRLAEILRKLARLQAARRDDDGFAGLLASHPALLDRARALDGERPATDAR